MSNSRLNHFICPRCHHDFYDGERVQVVCDACGKRFSIKESLTMRRVGTVGEQQAAFHAELGRAIQRNSSRG